MKPTVITISRQFGSLGREIGRLTAEMLDIGYYDKEIMGYASKAMGLSPEFFEETNQDGNGLYSIGYGSGFGSLANLSINLDANNRAGQFIQSIAQTEDAVVVGRCSDWFLRDHPDAIHVYICADLDDRVKRAMEVFGLNEKKARKKVKAMDESREAFYEFVTGQRFGDAKRFDLVINTSETSVEEAVAKLCALFDEKKGFTTLKGGFAGQYEHHKKAIG